MPVGAEAPVDVCVEVPVLVVPVELDCEGADVDVPVVVVVWFTDDVLPVVELPDPEDVELTLLPEPIVEGGGVPLAEVPMVLAFVWLYTERAPLLL